MKITKLHLLIAASSLAIGCKNEPKEVALTEPVTIPGIVLKNMDTLVSPKMIFTIT